MIQSKAKPMKVEGLCKSYGAVKVLAGIDMTVAPGEFICIVGPSGVGKTTLLRSLSGLTKLTAGRVVVGDKVMTEPLAEIGLVFQDYRGSLMPWMPGESHMGFDLI